MQYRGKLSVLSALHREEPVLIIVLGGGMASVVSVGVLEALASARLTRFKAGIGVSGGACNLAALYSAPDRMHEVMRVYEHLAYGGFMTWSMGWSGPRIAFDREELLQTLQGERAHLGLPSLNSQVIHNHPSALFFAATVHATGENRLLDGRMNLFQNLAASMAIPGACRPESVNGEELSDGCVSVRVGYSIRKVWARKVLVVMNRVPFEERLWWEQYFTPYITYLALMGCAPQLQNAAAQMEPAFSKDLQRLLECRRIETLVIAPDYTDPYLMPASTYVPELYRGYRRARDFTFDLIERARAR